MSSKCPCCSNSLLRHWKVNRMYWFCGHCRQEMPNLEALARKYLYQKQEQILTEKLSISHQFVAFHSPKKGIKA